ncbi:MAG TPA: hypothetical protein VGK19_11010 [Capsulimonadaceae bacterium]|jgi:hypothetical protein
MNLSPFPANQDAARARLYARHRETLDDFWNADGTFGWAKNTSAQTGFRRSLWHCTAYLGGDARCVERANKIIRAKHVQTPCHFAPGAALDVIHHYGDRLEPETVALLTRYLSLSVPYMATEDLKIHGYNDNHVYKAIHTLIVGGELLELPDMVERGLFKLRQAVDVFKRTDFPCEYNSSTYTGVSLQPLASLIESAKNEEARELALKLEQFYWRDVALHFDPRAGVPTGPMSRAYEGDYTARMSNILHMVALLFPDRFDFDPVEEVYGTDYGGDFAPPSVRPAFPDYTARAVWLLRPTYHVPQATAEMIFNKPVGSTVRGTTESGTSAISWTPETRPSESPRVHHIGPRRSTITTYYGDKHTLGTGRYSWLAGGQTHNFYATIARSERRHIHDATVYYARMFFDDNSPYLETPQMSSCFCDEGEIRTVQHEGSAMVFYNPLPIKGKIRRIRTGLFRPMAFNRPAEVWVGETRIPTLNYSGANPSPIAIDEGNVFVGIRPLMLTQPAQQARKANVQVQTYSDHLAILFSSFEAWGPTDLTYEAIIAHNSGFVFEIQSASAFDSFASFRKWLAAAEIEDDYYADMRTTTYRRNGLELSSCYSPFQSAFRYISVNGVDIDSGMTGERLLNL